MKSSLLLAVVLVSISQAQTQIQPSGGVQMWACISPPPEFPQWVSFSAWVRPNSGFHDHHDANRPTGSYVSTGGWTDSSGCVSTTWNAPALAGDYELTASSSGFTDTHAVYVVYTPYLQALGPGSTYQLVGNPPGSAHLSNHWGSFNAVVNIQNICNEFYGLTGIRAGANDMRIGWGGLFDIGPNYGPFWNQPHGAHQTGLNADFPFQYLGTTQQRSLFQQIATEHGGNPLVEGDHFHLRFPN
jgi:hypothetical protein